MKDLEIINELHAEWQALQPLKPEDDKRLWKKFQLEWNYHSNHIEGNTLTYGETELLLVHGQVTGTHSVRDVEEMKAHDLAITHLRELAESDRDLVEADIRTLNQILLKEPFWKDAISPDGKPTHNEIVPGTYKTQPNNVLLPDGSTFAFSAPNEVPAEMQELTSWLLKELASGDHHPVQVATILHHRFVLIHPFGDGNGRTARLLANYVLLRSGYPPVIVKTEDKAEYLAALHQADAGDLNPLGEFMANALKTSLNTGIKAAKGESIAEEGDLDKEIAIFVKNQTDREKNVLPKSKEVLQSLAESSFIPFLNLLTEKVKKFSPLFVDTHLDSNPPPPGDDKHPAKAFQYMMTQNQMQGLSITAALIGYKGEAREPFNLQHQLQIKFSQFEYSIQYQNSQIIRHLYSEPMLREEINDAVARIQSGIFAEIKKKITSE